MTALTVASVNLALVCTLKHQVELDVERTVYFMDNKSQRMFCHFYMKNGFVIEGAAFAHTDNLVTREWARKDGVQKIILIEQYMLAEKLYREAEQQNSNKQLGG